MPSITVSTPYGLRNLDVDTIAHVSAAIDSRAREVALLLAEELLSMCTIGRLA
jgi:hypothetical protein